MNAKDAADFLGISERALNRYTADGRITFKKVAKEGGGFTREFNQDELSEFKRTMGKRQGRVASPRAHLEHLDNPPTLPLAERQSDTLHLLSTAIAAALRDTISSTTAAERLGVPIEAKPLLKLAEAQALTGLSRDQIRSAIEAGSLKASMIGRAWRIKRQDIDAYISTL